MNEEENIHIQSNKLVFIAIIIIIIKWNSIFIDDYDDCDGQFIYYKK